jgi:UDP-N-acetylmuramate--alanine ligase
MAAEVTAEDLGRVHLIGIGGVGMSGLARMLLTRGIPVTGSELREWPALAGLRALGATIYSTHRPENLDGVDTVVYSTATAKHLELDEARRRGLRTLHRSEALAVAMRGRRVIAVAGTHGKTTTTSMMTNILQHAGLDPSFVIGVSEAGANGHHGSGEYFVAEADESDRSFLVYRPYVAILTNIDEDHLNTYGDMQSLKDTFVEFGLLVTPDGFSVACADDPGAREYTQRLRAAGRTVYTYGEAPDADLRLSEIRSSPAGVRYVATLDGESLGEISMPVPGRHLGLNSAAAVLVALRLGLEVETVAEALATFTGVRRRFELKGVMCGVRVYDEYAYHPTAMNAAIETLRAVAKDGRLLVVFQPNRVYRTRDLQDGIAAALAQADEVIVMEVFGPGEVREPGEGGVKLTAAIDLPEERKIFVPSWDDVAPEVVRRAREGDVVVTMGAPPISLLGDELLAALAGAGTGRHAFGAEADLASDYPARHARAEAGAGSGG